MKTPLSLIYRPFYLIAEFVLLLWAFHLAHLFRGLGYSQTLHDQVMMLYSIIAWYVISRTLNIHQYHPELKTRLQRLLISIFLFGMAVAMIGFLFKMAQYSRLLIGYYIICFAFFIVTLHLLGDYYYRRLHEREYTRHNLLIIGAGRVGSRVYEEALQHRNMGFEMLGFVDDNPSGKKYQDKILGTISNLESVVAEYNINELILALPLTQEDLITRLIEFADQHGIRIRMIPDIYRITSHSVELSSFGSIPILQFRKIPLDDPLNRVFKRLFDITFSLFILLLSSPVIVLAALAMKFTSRGPAFFVQERTGYNQNNFKCYKLRSMHVAPREIQDSVQIQTGDPRLTLFGNFLRKTNIDELPQFWNVLKGEMSVVGPRPHMLNHTTEFSGRVEDYLIRHFIKPGITGWAQVNGWRGPTNTDERLRRRIEFDLWYMDNWSFYLDLKIILKTIFSRQSRLNAF